MGFKQARPFVCLSGSSGLVKFVRRRETYAEDARF